MGTDMTSKLTFRLTLLALTAAGIVAIPADAMAAITDQVSGVATYWQEIAIGLAVITGMILVDTGSWSLMTSKK